MIFGKDIRQADITIHKPITCVYYRYYYLHLALLWKQCNKKKCWTKLDFWRKNKIDVNKM